MRKYTETEKNWHKIKQSKTKILLHISEQTVELSLFRYMKFLEHYGMDIDCELDAIFRTDN